jgi:hypothetical protein
MVRWWVGHFNKGVHNNGECLQVFYWRNFSLSELEPSWQLHTGLIHLYEAGYEVCFTNRDVEQNWEQKTVKGIGENRGHQLLLTEAFSTVGIYRRVSDPENAWHITGNEIKGNRRHIAANTQAFNILLFLN